MKLYQTFSSEPELVKALRQEKYLSDNEVEIVVLAAKGLSNEEVANQLFSTERIIKHKLPSIYKKMGVQSREQLIVWCLLYLGCN